MKLKDLDPPKPPQYARVVSLLSNKDLEDEMLLGLGEPGFQEQLRIEAAKRGLKTKRKVPR